MGNLSASLKSLTSKANAFYVVLDEPLFRAVLEFGRGWAFVRGDFPRVIRSAVIRGIGGDPRDAKRLPREVDDMIPGPAS